MKSSILLGLDVGTTSVKVAAYHADGEQVAKATKPYPTSYPRAGWAEQNPADWKRASFDALEELLQKLGEKSRRLAGIGLSAHAPGFVPVDSSGKLLLEKVPIWQDERCINQAKELLGLIGSDWVGLGMPFAAFPAKLKWFAETYPERYRLVKYALGVKAYLLHWLTGIYGTDPSSESGTLKDWAEIWSACGWTPDQFVPVYPATEVIGEMRKELRDPLGLIDPLPVVVGLNDGASATLGGGALKAGEAVITLGTNGVIFLVSDGPIPANARLDKALFCWPYIEGRWIVGGQTKSGARSLEWLSSMMWGPTSNEDRIEKLLLEAQNKPPGSNGVFFFPYLMGRGTPVDDPDATGAFLGLTLQHERGDLTRAVLEGVAFTLRDVLEELKMLGLPAKNISINGGGFRSRIWRSIIAETLDRELNYTNADSSLGAAMLASVGIGFHKDIETAQRKMAAGCTKTIPKQENVQIYNTLYQGFSLKRDLVLRSHR